MSDEPKAVLQKVHASVVIRERGNVLLVREGKPSNRDQWNLPGGHVEPGEAVAAAAVREAKEEAGLGVFLTELIGVYTGINRNGNQSVRFVFGAHAMAGEPTPGDDVLEVRWFPVEELSTLSDEELVSPKMFRRIAEDLLRGVAFPTSVLSEGL